MVNFINKKEHGGRLKGTNLIYDIDLNNAQLFLQKADYLGTLVEIRFLTPPQIEFFKRDSFSFEFASSGEKHLLFTMLNLISRVKKNSLILIDEPEISMHPAWQMKYINLIKKILVDFPGCHCILASHSHFMVSDLNPQSSTLIQIVGTPNDEMSHRKTHLIEHDTYSWSAENILYEVFGMRTSRNYYFEQDISELLTLISHNSSEINRINELATKFENIVFDKRDPLNDVIQSAKAYVEKHND